MITRTFSDSQVRSFLWDARHLWMCGYRISATKMIRFVTGFDLASSKSWAEVLAADHTKAEILIQEMKNVAATQSKGS